MKNLIAIMFLLCSSTGYAATVYKTVGENGVVSFSDTPPEGEALTEVLQITPTAPQSPEDHLERMEDMREVTDRMAADRREREKHRAELRETRARAESYQRPEQPGYTEYADYYPTYPQRYWRHNRPPWRPGFRPQPEQPIARPPMRSSRGSSGSSNAQLMRPLVSKRP